MTRDMVEQKSILIVEDELISAYDLASVLEQLGYGVTGIVDTGEDAIAHVQANLPNLVLMDIQLAGQINGIEASQKLQSYPVPIVYLTAYSDEVTIEKAIPTCPYGYLTKPIQINNLRTTLAVTLSKFERDQHNQELLAAQQRLNDLKSNFMSVLAHDFRNPLAGMLMSLEMLQHYEQKLDQAKKEKHYQRMRKAIGRLNAQFEELLTLTRVESEKLPFNPQPVDVIALCEDLVADYDDLESDSSRLNFIPDSDCGTHFLDPQLLRHILGNLLSNAVKYSPAGSPVEFRLICTRQAVTFEVRDRGIGIPPEDLDTLFKPFERASNASKIQGTGIGLYIVKQAVDHHQGTITVDSEVGVGSVFTVTLPSVGE